MDYQGICIQVVNLARQTGSYLKEERARSAPDLERKGKNDFVTRFDKEAEVRIVDALSEILPDSGFIAEEGTGKGTSGRFNWVIDPIDGTTNFIHGLSPFSVSIALMEGEELVIGVVYEPGLDECFYAWKNGSAMLNGQVISVSKTEMVSDALVATGFPYTNFSRMDNYMDSLRFLMNNCRGVRRMGSAAVDLVYVACGRFDGFYEYGLKPWDVAAGSFILDRAGGKVSDFSGGNDYLYGREIIATNKSIFEEFLKVVSGYLI
ncbi:inositol monophosphatase family protein [Natronoflexus pectinivorans]|uniref:Inositol-1-monophosphatase n=1 Tax=Natronoflexus pectinivorans TaxID=682526 RepID=A0A4R2GPC8_9BACT|nr:inositol monophosphatase family protein [Natronoflexus pectinivorans]TCO09656.1 myo-inositol-1(or 4)-monophosphatase [Natronoflexus pectinivorans]